MRSAAPGLLAVALSAPGCSSGSDIAEVNLANAAASPAPTTVLDSSTTTSASAALADSSTTSASTDTGSSRDAIGSTDDEPLDNEATTNEAPGIESTDTVSPSDAEQIRAVIDLYWHALVVGMDPPDPDHDLWALVAAGTRLEGLRATAALKRHAGEVNRYRGEPHPLVTRADLVGVDNGLAIVNLCVFDDTLLVDGETGEILDDELRLGWLQHLLELTPDGWRVIRTLLIERHDTVDQCASAF